MKLFDTLLGRTKPVKPDLDAVFALPSAAVTLQASAGLISTGRAGVCFKPPAGQPFEEVQKELEELLAMKDDDLSGSSAATGATGPLAVRHETDRYGYRWVIVEGTDIDDLVTRAHMVHSSLTDAGWGPQLLCSAFGFRPPSPGESASIDEPVEIDGTSGTDDLATDLPPAQLGKVEGAIYLVYLAKRGTFYPFAPTGPEQRDTELELRIRAVLGHELPVESELDRWFPLWDLPIA